MTKWDKEYIKLCSKILDEGVRVQNRTGIDTIKIPSYHLHFDLSEEFPVLATKQLFFRQAIIEMLWIYPVSYTHLKREKPNIVLFKKVYYHKHQTSASPLFMHVCRLLKSAFF